MIWTWQFLALPFGLELRTSTLVMSIALFGMVSWQTRSPWRGFVVLAAWISAYEVLYGETIWALGRSMLIDFLPVAGLLGWVLLALWMGHRPQWEWLLVFASCWLIWLFWGFHANDHGLRLPLSVADEVLNVATKTALGLAYMFGSWVTANRVMVSPNGGELPANAHVRFNW